MFHTQKNICSSWLNLQQHQAVLYIFCYKKKEFPKVFPQSCVRILSTPGCGSTVFICPTVSYIEAPSCCSLFEVALVFSWVSWCKEFLDRFSFWHLSDTWFRIWLTSWKCSHGWIHAAPSGSDVTKYINVTNDKGFGLTDDIFDSSDPRPWVS